MGPVPTPATHVRDPETGLWLPRRAGVCSALSGMRAGAGAMQGARRRTLALTDWADLDVTRAGEAALVDSRNGWSFDGPTATGEQGFSASDHYVLPTGDDIVGSATMTRSLLIRCDANPSVTEILFENFDSPGGWYIQALTTRAIRWVIREGTASYVAESAPLAVGGIYALTATWDGTTQRIVVNQVAVAATPGITYTPAASSTPGLGADSNTTSFASSFTLLGAAASDSVALTEAQAKAHNATTLRALSMRSFSGVENLWRAPNLATDLVGSLDWTPVGSTTTDTVKLAWLTANVGRILADGAILIEGARTNLISESADLSAWGGSGPVTTSADPAPDGSTMWNNADDTDVGGTARTLSLGSLSAADHALSVYVPQDANTSRRPAFGMVDGGSGLAEYTLRTTDGTVAVGRNTSSGTLVPRTPATLGAGFYRMAAVLQSTPSGAATARVVPATFDSGNALNTSLVDDADYWGMQVEQASYASSLIRTSGATATRAAERAVLAAADVPAEILTGAYEIDVWPLFDSGDAGTHQVLYASSTRRLTITSGTVTLVSDGGTDSVGSLTWSAHDKLTIGVDPAGNLSVSVNGGAASTTPQSGDWSDVAGDLDVGSDGAGADHINGTVSQVRPA